MEIEFNYGNNFPYLINCHHCKHNILLYFNIDMDFDQAPYNLWTKFRAKFFQSLKNGFYPYFFKTKPSRLTSCVKNSVFGIPVMNRNILVNPLEKLEFSQLMNREGQANWPF